MPGEDRRDQVGEENSNSLVLFEESGLSLEVGGYEMPSHVVGSVDVNLESILALSISLKSLLYGGGDLQRHEAHTSLDRRIYSLSYRMTLLKSVTDKEKVMGRERK